MDTNNSKNVLQLFIVAKHKDVKTVNRIFEIVNISIKKYSKFKYKDFEGTEVVSVSNVLNNMGGSRKQTLQYGSFALIMKQWNFEHLDGVYGKRLAKEFYKFIKYICKSVGYNLDSFQIRMDYFEDYNIPARFPNKIFFYESFGDEIKSSLISERSINNAIRYRVQIYSKFEEDIILMYKFLREQKNYVPRRYFMRNGGRFTRTLSVRASECRKICNRLKISDIKELTEITFMDPDALVYVRETEIENLSISEMS